MNLAHPGASPEESELFLTLERSIDGLAKERIHPRRIDQDKRLPPGLLPALSELGLFGLSIPEAYGGAQLSLHATGSIIAALSRHDRAVATTVGLHGGLGTRGLVEFADEDQKARYLPDLASGAKLSAFSATEAGAGSDLSALRSTARLDGDELVIDGAKVYVTNAHLADVFTVALSTPGLGGARRGQSIVVLERADAGLTLGGPRRTSSACGAPRPPPCSSRRSEFRRTACSSSPARARRCWNRSSAPGASSWPRAASAPGRRPST